MPNKSGLLYFTPTEKKVYEKTLLPLVVFEVIEKKTNPILVSKGATHFFNCSREEVLNCLRYKKYECIHPDDKEKIETSELLLLSKTRYEKVTFRFKFCEKEDYTWIETRGIRQEFDGKAFIFLSYTDVSNEYSNQSFLRFVANKHSDFSIRVNIKTDDYTFFNSKSSDHTFYNGNNFFDSIKDDIIQRIDKNDVERLKKILKKEYILETLKKTDTISILYHKKTNTEEVITKQLHISYIDTDKKYICIIQQDISKEVAFTELKNKELNNALALTNKANKAKEDFLANMSHDMRTPLNSIINYAKFSANESENKQVQNYCTQIIDSGYYLLGIINDILESTKLSREKFSILKEVHSSSEFLNNIKQIVMPKVEKKNILFSIECLGEDIPYQKFDFVHSTQIIVNILNNALKYTPENGKVLWTIEHIKKRNTLFCHHTISDNGIGISKAFLKKLYEPFEREQNELSLKEGGTGLGLAICKRNVDALGGFIECTSTLGEGTTFVIDIPTEESTKAAFEKNKSTIGYDESNFAGKNILICEDIDINSQILKKLLESKNMNAEIAKNGEEGIKKTQKHDFDAILMDIRMPVMNGLEATKKIRMFNPEIPIIALSANAFSEDIQKSIKVGMNGHLSKPIDTKTLFSTLGAIFSTDSFNRNFTNIEHSVTV